MFVIKGAYKGEEIYYIKTYINDLGYTVKEFSCTIEGATKYKTPDDAEIGYQEMNNNSFYIYSVCPKCNKIYSGAPALSRDDNKTFICSACGTKEALINFSNSLKQ